MTSEIGVAPKFLFQCPCGAKIVTRNKTVTCGDCGKTMGVIRVRTRRKHRHAEPLLGPVVLLPTAWRPRREEPGYNQLFRCMATAHSSRHQLESVHSNSDCIFLGFLFFLLPVYAPILPTFLIWVSRCR